MSKDSITIKVSGGIEDITIRCRSFYLVAVEESGELHSVRQNALENSTAEDMTCDTILAGTMIFAANSLLESLEKDAPDADPRAQAEKLYTWIQEETAKKGAQE